nr:hypothetical protein [uncultured Pseudogulbenkiania sp.]
MSNNPHTFQRLVLRDDVYSDVSEVTDENGFCIINVELQPILLNYAEKLGIAHWADNPHASLDLTEEQQRANARRIVACVNACTGISTYALERGQLLDAHGLEEKNDELSRRNEELLAALMLALPFVEDHEGSEVYKSGAVSNALGTIKAAIAAAKGGAA